MHMKNFGSHTCSAKEASNTFRSMVMFVIDEVLKSWEHAAKFMEDGRRQGPEKQGFYPYH